MRKEFSPACRARRCARNGAIRIDGDRIAAIGDLAPEPGEHVIDASGCVIYPGLVSTHHHLFQSILKGVRSGINLPLMGWLRSVPHAYWSEIGEEELYVAARIGLVELLLSGTTTAADHHYMFSDTYRFDPADVIFAAARDLGMRLVFCRGGATVFRTFDTPGYKPMPTEPLDAMIKSVEACAQRYHDPSPASMSRVVFAPTAPPWALRGARAEGGRRRRAPARACACTATCRRRPTMSTSAWRNSASARSIGSPSTTGSGPTCGSPISSISTTRRCSSCSTPAPAWRIARSRTAGSAPASRRPT